MDGYSSGPQSPSGREPDRLTATDVVVDADVESKETCDDNSKKTHISDDWMKRLGQLLRPGKETEFAVLVYARHTPIDDPSSFLRNFDDRVASYCVYHSGRYVYIRSTVFDYPEGKLKGLCMSISLDGSVCDQVRPFIPCLTWISVRGKDLVYVVTNIEYRGCSVADAMDEVVEELINRGKPERSKPLSEIAPFAIVSLGLGTMHNSVKDSIDRLKATMDFLKKKMENNKSDLSNEEAMQTAISAFQCLLQKNLKADAIRMLSLDLDWFTTRLILHRLIVPASAVRRNKVCLVKEIEEHLTAVNIEKATDCNPSNQISDDGPNIGGYADIWF